MLGKYVAVIPEYIEGLPARADLAKEWPEHRRPVHILGDQLAVAHRLEGARCEEFQFGEVQRAVDHLLYYSAYPTRMNICLAP